VRIIQGDRIVTGDNAVLFYKEQKVIVTGDTMMQEGKNKIKGGKITFFMKEKRGTVERAEKEKVTATIYPEDEQ
jgi:lipopolysaccharide export system protein LptA